MGWAVKSVVVLLILGVTVLGIHSEHLGLGPGDRQVYGIPAWAKLSVMMLFVIVVLGVPRSAMKVLLLGGIGAIWLIQQQSIRTSSTAEPPQVSVWLGGIVRTDTAHLCIETTGDDVFARPDVPITTALKDLSFADVNCNPRKAPLYIEVPFVAVFAPAGDDPLRARISKAIDHILGVT